MDSVCDLLLYYVVEIITPFSSQKHLDGIRKYINNVSSEMNNKIIVNPVNSSNFTEEEMKRKNTTQTSTDELTPEVQLPKMEPQWERKVDNNMIIYQEDDEDEDEAYKRLSTTLPLGVLENHNFQSFSPFWFLTLFDNSNK